MLLLDIDRLVKFRCTDMFPHREMLRIVCVPYGHNYDLMTVSVDIPYTDTTNEDLDTQIDSALEYHLKPVKDFVFEFRFVVPSRVITELVLF